MTHPIVEAVAAKLRKHEGSPHHDDTAAEIVAEVLRMAKTNGPWFRPPPEWTEGLDALLKGIEE